MKKYLKLLPLLALTGCCVPKVSNEIYYLPNNFPHLPSPRSGLDNKYWMNSDPDMARPLNASYPIPAYPLLYP